MSFVDTLQGQVSKELCVWLRDTELSVSDVCGRTATLRAYIHVQADILPYDTHRSMHQDVLQGDVCAGLNSA